jgi:hypothetical protein
MYITALDRDPFSPLEGATFVYWCVNRGDRLPSNAVEVVEKTAGWILVSTGPDGDYDIGDDLSVYDPRIGQLSNRLLAGTNKRGSAYTWDPTNGTVSDGDIWRVKQ